MARRGLFVSILFAISGEFDADKQHVDDRDDGNGQLIFTFF
jgi:hypothetical protein